MKKIFLLIFSLIILSSFCLAEEPVDVKQTSPVYNIFNFHIVAPGIMRSAQPSEKGFDILKKHYNLKTVLSLRDNKERIEWERKLLEKLNIAYINIPMSGREKQSKEKIDQALEIINDKSRQPILVHCYSGKDRTGLVFAAYRIRYDNWSFEEAFLEMLAYGYNQVDYSPLKESLIEWNK